MPMGGMQAMARGTLKVGERVAVRHGFLWRRTGNGTIRAIYQKEGRHFASVELDGSGKLLPRLLSQLQVIGKEEG
jgi:hypothetical protein